MAGLRPESDCCPPLCGVSPPRSQPSDTLCCVCATLLGRLCQLSLPPDARRQSSLTFGPLAPGSNWQPDLLCPNDRIKCTQRKKQNMCTCITIVREINVIPMWFRVIKSCRRRSADRVMSNLFCRWWCVNCVCFSYYVIHLMRHMLTSHSALCWSLCHSEFWH